MNILDNNKSKELQDQINYINNENNKFDVFQQSAFFNAIKHFYFLEKYGYLRQLISGGGGTGKTYILILIEKFAIIFFGKQKGLFINIKNFFIYY